MKKKIYVYSGRPVTVGNGSEVQELIYTDIDGNYLGAIDYFDCTAGEICDELAKKYIIVQEFKDYHELLAHLTNRS